MSYTPINWQTGDTITAEKLNKMDNGWGVESTQLFSETVTTEADGDENYGLFEYSELISAPSITVTFNGTDYICNRVYIDGYNLYGGVGEEGLDFSQYPFVIRGAGNYCDIFTENPGTYTVAVTGHDVVVGVHFTDAVVKAEPERDFEIILGVTTWVEASNAIYAKKNVFYHTQNRIESKKVLALTTVSEPDFKIYGISIDTDIPSITLETLVASSYDGVLSLDGESDEPQ